MNTLKGIGAILAGMIFIVFSHTGTDFVLESLGIFTPPEQGISHYLDGSDRNNLPLHLYGGWRLHYSRPGSKSANATRSDSRINRACAGHYCGNSHNTDETRPRMVSNRVGCTCSALYLAGRKIKDQMTCGKK